MKNILFGMLLMTTLVGQVSAQSTRVTEEVSSVIELMNMTFNSSAWYSAEFPAECTVKLVYNQNFGSEERRYQPTTINLKTLAVDSFDIFQGEYSVGAEIIWVDSMGQSDTFRGGTTTSYHANQILNHFRNLHSYCSSL